MLRDTGLVVSRFGALRLGSAGFRVCRDQRFRKNSCPSSASTCNFSYFALRPPRSLDRGASGLQALVPRWLRTLN